MGSPAFVQIGEGGTFDVVFFKPEHSGRRQTLRRSGTEHPFREVGLIVGTGVGKQFNPSPARSKHTVLASGNHLDAVWVHKFSAIHVWGDRPSAREWERLSGVVPAALQAAGEDREGVAVAVHDPRLRRRACWTGWCKLEVALIK